MDEAQGHVAQLLGLFTVAGIPVQRHWTISNGYWPDTEHYADIRRRHPWALVKTPWGLVSIGWRKRVMEIEWEDTPVRGEITPDNVTKGPTLVHAWSYEKALAYLQAWRSLAAKSGQSVDIRQQGNQP